MIKRVSAMLLLGCLAIPSLAAEPLSSEDSDNMSPPSGYGMVQPPEPATGDDGFGVLPEADPLQLDPIPYAAIDFTPAQRKTISQMVTKERKTNQQRIQLMRQAEARLSQLFAADTWNSKAILAAYDQIFTAEHDTVAAMARLRNQVYGMLNDEQRAQLQDAQQSVPPFMPSVQP